MDDFLLDEKQQHSNNLPEFEKKHTRALDEDTPNRGDTAQFAAMQTTSKKYGNLHQDMHTDILNLYVQQESQKQSVQAFHNRSHVGQLVGLGGDLYSTEPQSSQA